MNSLSVQDLHRHWGMETTSHLGLRVLRHGSRNAPAVLFLHGWPLDASSYTQTMLALGESCLSLAPDLPGVGGSVDAAGSGEKAHIADVLKTMLDDLKIKRVVLVGQDCGGMVTYAFMRKYPEITIHALIGETAIPGVDPWSEVLRTPHMFHFALHAVPKLPEALISGREGIYFDFFYDYLAGPNGVSSEARARYTASYLHRRSLQTGFDWYRAFPEDSEHNQAEAKRACSVPLLYVRGDKSPAKIEDYIAGFRAANMRHVQSHVLPGCGHFISEEKPKELAALVTRVLATTVPPC